MTVTMIIETAKTTKKEEMNISKDNFDRFVSKMYREIAKSHRLETEAYNEINSTGFHTVNSNEDIIAVITNIVTKGLL